MFGLFFVDEDTLWIEQVQFLVDENLSKLTRKAIPLAPN